MAIIKKDFFKLFFIIVSSTYICAKLPIQTPTGLPQPHREQIDNTQTLRSALRLLSHAQDQDDIDHAIHLLEDIISNSDLGPNDTVNSARSQLSNILELRIGDPQALTRARVLRESYLTHQQPGDNLQEVTYVLFRLASMYQDGMGGPVNNTRAYQLLTTLVNNYRNYPQMLPNKNLLYTAQIALAYMHFSALGTPKSMAKARALLEEVQAATSGSQDPHELAFAQKSQQLLNLFPPLQSRR